MDWITVVGMVAACCTTLSFVPQALQTIRTKNTSAISGAMYSLFTAGTFFWFMYGIFSNNLPVIIANAVTLLLSSVILYFKLRYR